MEETKAGAKEQALPPAARDRAHMQSLALRLGGYSQHFENLKQSLKSPCMQSPLLRSPLL